MDNHSFISFSMDWPDYVIVIMGLTFATLCILQYYSEAKIKNEWFEVLIFLLLLFILPLIVHFLLKSQTQSYYSLSSLFNTFPNHFPLFSTPSLLQILIFHFCKHSCKSGLRWCFYLCWSKFVNIIEYKNLLYSYLPLISLMNQIPNLKYKTTLCHNWKQGTIL